MSACVVCGKWIDQPPFSVIAGNTEVPQAHPECAFNDGGGACVRCCRFFSDHDEFMAHLKACP
jgi:hypothetical protein